MGTEPQVDRASRRWLERVRFGGLIVVPLAATAFFLWFVHDLYPIQHWLFWRYLGAWLLSALFAAACVSAGFGTLRLLLRSPLPFAEQFAIAFAVGVYEFFLAMFVGGLLGLYGSVWFALLPALFVGAGAWPLFRYLRRTRRHWLASRRKARPPSPLSYPILAFGLLGLVMIYFVILTPENASFDARWQHLGVGEMYAASGGIRRSPVGNYLTTVPHLTATIYAWAMQMPLSTLFDRVELAAHIEFFGFLFTLVGVSAIARRLVGLPRPRHAWVARFLFPAVLLYDSSLSVGADHVAAIFAAPIFLALLRAWHEPSPRWLLLLVTAMSGAAMTKYTGALLLIGFPILLMALRFSIAAVRGILRRSEASPRQLLGALGVALGGGLLLTAPHWLKNWIWYGDPFYPLLHARLNVHPWTVDSAARFAGYLKTNMWRPERNFAGLRDSLKVLVTFSFVPNDWPQFHGSWPVLGSLFTFGLGLLPFLRRTRRIWLLYAAVHFGIFVWYWIHHQDRYLQAVMPLVAGGTAAVLTLAWRRHWTAKIGIGLLVGASIVWGGDIYFIQTHAMIGSAPKASLDLLSQGFKQNYKARIRPYGASYEIGKQLPRDAVLLLHEGRATLGLRANLIIDHPLHQGGLSYARLRSPRELYETFDRMGVTHLLYTQGSEGYDNLAGDLVFFSFVTSFAAQPRQVSGGTLALLPNQPPSATWDDRVLVLACNGSEYPTGVYHLEQLTLPAIPVEPKQTLPLPIEVPSGDRVARLVDKLDFIVLDRRCQTPLVVAAKPALVLGAKRQHLELWVRRLGAH